MIKDILMRAEKLNVHEIRAEKPEYHEFVVYIKDIGEWEKVFKEEMGLAVKPSGSNVTDEHLLITEEYGGIEKGQTLYVKKDETGATMIMLWPWQDKEHVTIKMVYIQGR